MCHGFKSRLRQEFFFFFCFFIYLIIFYDFLSLLLQCKFANSTLLSLLTFSYFITPYDAQASSAFSALIVIWYLFKYKIIKCDGIRPVTEFFLLLTLTKKKKKKT